MNTMRVELFLISNLPATETLLDYLVDEYGGYTSITGDGAYQMQDNTVTLDEVTIATVFIDDTPQNRKSIHGNMQQYLNEAEQESVLYVINGNHAIFIKE